MRRLIPWLLILALLVGCQPKSTPATVSWLGGQDGINRTIPLVEGTVVDLAGAPVEGARVRAYRPLSLQGEAGEATLSLSTTSDAAGRFALRDVPVGTLAVEASRPGVDKALRRGLQLVAGQSLDLGTMQLAPTGAIRGHLATRTGANLLGADVFVPGTDYLAKATASGDFAIDEVPVGVYSVAVMAPRYRPLVVESVEVLSERITELPSQTLELDVPELLEVDPSAAGPGAWVTLRGHHFGADVNSVLQVTFGGTAATTLNRLSDDAIQVKVPADAASGPVVIYSNGAPSQGVAFQVLARLSLGASVVGLYPGQWTTWSLTAFDGAGRPAAVPGLDWQLDNSNLGVLEVASSSFRAGDGYGVARLTVASGQVQASAWVGVSPFRLESVYGNGMSGLEGDGGAAAIATIGHPTSIARDTAGNLYVSQHDDPVVRRIAPDGTITRFAGSGNIGLTGDGGPALEAQLGTGAYLEVDPDQRLWLASPWQCVVRFIPLDDRFAPHYRKGYVYRAAGTGVSGYDGSGKYGPESRLNAPRYLACSPEGMLVADFLNDRIRLITWDLRLLDVLGKGTGLQLEDQIPVADAAIHQPTAIARDSRGNWIIATITQLLFDCRVSGTYFGRDCLAEHIYVLTSAKTRFEGDGPIPACGFQEIVSLQIDEAGNCLFTDGPSLIRRLSTLGRIDTLAGRPSEALDHAYLGFDVHNAHPHEVSLGAPFDLKRDEATWWVTSSFYNRILRLSPR